MKLITIFTPTYNRAHTISRTYQSLLEQDSKNFIWLIIDDGSTDGTKQLVDEWQKNNNGFEIIYKYKKNGGMHTAHNLAYRNISTELNVCIDSDDILAPNAIAIIENVWNKIKEQNYAGIIGLDADFSGIVIGSIFENEGVPVTLSGFYQNGGMGDKKLVYRTDIINKYPEYPEFEGEKLVPLSFKYFLCDQDYMLFPINKVLCNVEYQVDGSTKNIWKQYLKSPRGFAEFRKMRMTYSTSLKQIFTDAIHYVSSSIISKNRLFLKESPHKLITVFAVPLGLILYLFIRIKCHNNG